MVSCRPLGVINRLAPTAPWPSSVSDRPACCVGAAVALGVVVLGTVAMAAVACRTWAVVPAAATFTRSAAVCLFAYALASVWSATGWWVVPELFVISVLIPSAFYGLGELKPDDVTMIRSYFARRPPPPSDSYVIDEV